MPNFYFEEFDSREHSRAASPCRPRFVSEIPPNPGLGAIGIFAESEEEAEQVGCGWTVSAPASLATGRLQHLSAGRRFSTCRQPSPLKEGVTKQICNGIQTHSSNDGSWRIHESAIQTEADFEESNPTRVWSKKDFQELLEKLKKLGEEQNRSEAQRQEEAHSALKPTSEEDLKEARVEDDKVQEDVNEAKAKCDENPHDETPTSETSVRKSYATQAWSKARSRKVFAELEKEWALEEESPLHSPFTNSFRETEHESHLEPESPLPRKACGFRMNNDWDWDFPKAEAENQQHDGVRAEEMNVDDLPWKEGEVMSIYHFASDGQEDGWFGTLRSEGDAVQLLEICEGKPPAGQYFQFDTVRTAPATFDTSERDTEIAQPSPPAFEETAIESNSDDDDLETIDINISNSINTESLSDSLSRLDSPTSDLEFDEFDTNPRHSTIAPGTTPYFTYTAPFPPPRLRMRSQPSTVPYLDLLAQLHVGTACAISEKSTSISTEHQGRKLQIRLRNDSSLLNASARILPKRQQTKGTLYEAFSGKSKTYASLQVEIGEKFWQLQAERDEMMGCRGAKVEDGVNSEV